MLFAAVVLGAACGVAPGRSAGPGELATGTWSIVAVDVGTREVGVALASCVPAALSISSSEAATADGGTGVRSYSVEGRGAGQELARLVAGVGVIVAQARVDRQNRDRLDRAAAQLVAGESPASIVEAAKVNDLMFAERQTGVVTLAPNAANFTGNATNDWAGAVRGEVVSVQGNLLVGPEVVNGALAAFRLVDSRPETTLGDALIAALEAGAAEGGDKRCPKEQTALTAFIAVARPDDTEEIPHLWLATQPQSIGGENPVSLLRQAYDATQPPHDETLGGSDGTPRLVWWPIALIAPLLGGLALWTTLRRRRGGVQR